jgi:peptide/nickel transport system permease protein
VIRYLKYLKNMLTWSFGITLSNKPVAVEMVWRIPYTLILLGGSGVLAIVIGVVLGALAAYKRGGTFDTVSVVSSLVFFSLPTFWMGLVFILIFYTDLGWFPHAGAFPYEWSINAPKVFNVTTTSANPLGMVISISPNDLWAYTSGILKHAFLPVMTLTLFQYGAFLLLSRATMIEALTEDYIVTARAKGVTERNVVFRHALKKRFTASNNRSCSALRLHTLGRHNNRRSILLAGTWKMDF